MTNQTPTLIEHAIKASGVHQRLVSEVWPKGVLATCPCCKAQQQLAPAQAVDCLANGWPKCCGHSMTISEVK